MAKTLPHVHKLKRLNFKSGSKIYFCASDCNYKVSVPLALGKKTICWRCEEVFVMNEYTIRLARPHCETCHKPRDQNNKHQTPPTLAEKELVNEFIENLSLADKLKQTIQSHSDQMVDVMNADVDAVFEEDI